MFGETIIHSVLISTDSNTIEVVKREKSNMMYACNPPRQVPDRVWKEIYGVVDGNIQLLDTITGKHEPNKFIEEKITFE